MLGSGVKIAGLLGIAVLLLTGCAFILSSASSPFAWLGLVLFGLCILVCATARAPLLRNAALMLAFFALPLALVELYLGWQSPNTYVFYEPEGANYQESDLLGYGPRPGAIISAKRYHTGELIYDARYSIDSSGLRVAPANAGVDSQACLLFFGGSFTFGEGLNDADTVANQASLMSSGDTQVYNFGYSGYGPHQMLAALDSGWVRKIASPCEKVTAVYTGVTQHINRVAGYSWWDLHGPAYALDENGKLRSHGHFDDGARKLVQRMRAQALKSHIFSLLFSLRLNRYYSEANVELYAAIVAAGGEALREQFGRNAQFRVFLWHPDFFGEDPQGYANAKAALQNRGVQTQSIDRTVLPDGNLDIYKIHPREGHPNAMANQKVADFILDAITR